MSLVSELQRAGLTGRGGAAFRTDIKVAAAQDATARLIVNACDGEIGASKDGWVVAHHLDELVAGARLIAPGRRPKISFAAHRGSRTAAALAAAGLRVLEVPERYVSSEESSLISLDNRGLARPLTKRDLFVRGGRDSAGNRVRPTAVLNAETVWRVAQIDAYGADWFRSFGTPEEPGPRLATVVGAVRTPQVIETQAGVALGDLIALAHPVVAAPDVALNGLSGVFIEGREASRATWSREGLAPHGGSIGGGVIEALDPRACPLRLVAARLRYAAGETAGQCGPCMFGVPALANGLLAYLQAPSPAGLADLTQRMSLLPNRGACRFPDGVARFADSALRVYGGHLAEHVGGRCPIEGGSDVRVA